MNEARVNITYAGANGDLPDTVNFDAPDTDILTWVGEALLGGIPGIDAQTDPNLNDFVVDRFPPNEQRGALISIRPKTPFGGV